jgi:hypothetical protein
MPSLIEIDPVVLGEEVGKYEELTDRKPKKFR